MTTVRLNSFDGASAEKRKFAENAIRLMESIVNNPVFLEKVENGNYTGREFTQDNDVVINADNRLILSQIVTGKEFKTAPDDVINIQARLERLSRKNVVGYVYPPDPHIITNTSFFNDWLKKSDTLSLAAHWMHEWTHVSGFKHADGKPDGDDVSYKVGTFVVETGRSTISMFNTTFAEMQGKGYLDAYEAVFGKSGGKRRDGYMPL